MKRAIKAVLSAATRNRFCLRILDATVVKAANHVALARRRSIESAGGSHGSVHARLANHTRLPEDVFYANLTLVSSVQALPGSVVECGVWRGGMSAGMACVLGPERSYYLFDSFEGLPDATVLDGPKALEWQRNNRVDRCRTGESYAHEAMKLAGSTSYRVIKGWFHETLPAFRAEPRIAVLRLDADWYSSTAECLNHLYHQVIPAGLIILDDYYAWDGCARAIHDFLSVNKLCDRIQQHEGLVCYLRKTEDVRVQPIDPGGSQPGSESLIQAV